MMAPSSDRNLSTHSGTKYAWSVFKAHFAFQWRVDRVSKRTSNHGRRWIGYQSALRIPVAGGSGIEAHFEYRSAVDRVSKRTLHHGSAANPVRQRTKPSPPPRKALSVTP